MEYRKIEQLVYNNNLINRENFKSRFEYNTEVEKLLICNLKKCIDKKIPLDMDELDFVKIYKIYMKLLKKKYPIEKDFIFNIADLSTKKLDYLGIIQEITE